MGVNHRRRDIFVSEQFLNCPDVVTGLKQMCSKTVAKSMAAGGFVHTGSADGEFDGVLEVFLRGVVTAGFPAPRIDAQFCRWKHVLPRPGAGSIHVLAVERVRQVNGPATSSKILAMQFVNPRKMGLKGTF